MEIFSLKSKLASQPSSGWKENKAAGPEGQAPAPGTARNSPPGSLACPPQAQGRMRPLSPSSSHLAWSLGLGGQPGGISGALEPLSQGKRTAGAAGVQGSSGCRQGQRTTTVEPARRGSGVGPGMPPVLTFFLPLSCLPGSLLSLALSLSVSLSIDVSAFFFLRFVPPTASLSLCVSVSSCPSLSISDWVPVCPCPSRCLFFWVFLCVSPSLPPPAPPPLPSPLCTHVCLSIPAGTGCGWTAAQKCSAAWTSAPSRPSTARTAETTSSR